MNHFPLLYRVSKSGVLFIKVVHACKNLSTWEVKSGGQELKTILKCILKVNLGYMKSKTIETKLWLWSRIWMVMMKKEVYFWSSWVHVLVFGQHEGKLSHTERKRSHVLLRNGPQTEKAFLHNVLSTDRLKPLQASFCFPVCVWAGPSPLLVFRECFLCLNLEGRCHMRKTS